MSRSLPSSVPGVSLRPLLYSHFYFAMALLIVAIVLSAFSFTVNANLIHAAIPRPLILYVHAIISVVWLGLFVLQSALIRSRNIRLHKRLGLAMVVLGCVMVVVGFTTIMGMLRFNIAHGIAQGTRRGFVAVPINDMLTFAACFAAAVLLRRQPEYHRRLMLIATAALTAAAWGRFPHFPVNKFYIGVDGLLSLGVLRDFIVLRHIHRAYLYALPAVIAGQATALAIGHIEPAWFLALVHAVAGGQ